jgi:hypothetical protein
LQYWRDFLLTNILKSDLCIIITKTPLQEGSVKLIIDITPTFS